MLSHTRMGVPYEYTHLGHPIRVWAYIRIWGRTTLRVSMADLPLSTETRVEVACEAVFFQSQLAELHNTYLRSMNALMVRII